MITTRFITNRDFIDEVLSQCIELEGRSKGSIPINYITVSLIWWDHFNSANGEDFGKKRGRNYLGARSRLSNLNYLIIKVI